MPFLTHLSADDMLNFTHRGFVLGVVPVYLTDPAGSLPLLTTCNGIPELWLDLWQALFDTFCTFAAIVAPDFVPTFPIYVTGRLDGAPLEPSL